MCLGCESRIGRIEHGLIKDCDAHGKRVQLALIKCEEDRGGRDFPVHVGALHRGRPHFTPAFFKSLIIK